MTIIEPESDKIPGSWWDALPTADEAPPGARKRERSASSGISRRRLLQGMGAVGGALALNGLGWISGAGVRRANATVGTEYTNCANYDNWSGYNNNTLVCVGGPYSYIYCGSDGWFKNGYFDGGNTQYMPTKACGAGGLAARNAWRWPYGGSTYRCADGYFRYYQSGSGWTGWMFKICSQWIG